MFQWKSKYPCHKFIKMLNHTFDKYFIINYLFVKSFVWGKQQFSDKNIKLTEITEKKTSWGLNALLVWNINVLNNSLKWKLLLINV